MSSGGEEGVQGGLGGRRGWKDQGWIAQEYIQRPLLIRGRKFDLRCFVLVVDARHALAPAPATNAELAPVGSPGAGAGFATGLRAYVYRDAYARTSSTEYSLSTETLSDAAMHLTNDAVQKKQLGGEYGKFEAANKLSLLEFGTYLSEQYQQPQDYVQHTLFPAICKHVRVSIEAALLADRDTPVDLGIPPLRNASSDAFRDHGCDAEAGPHTHELFGYDFMLDGDFNLQLIEVNSNPCMER